MGRIIDEYVLINGVEHYFLHNPSESDEVLLYLHGGPGETAMYFNSIVAPYFEPYAKLIFYDQRGTGRTRLKMKPEDKATVTTKQLLADLHEVVLYLCQHYQVERIGLIGHSWGSVLGTLYVKEHPQRIRYYIGIGQVIDMQENERVGFEKLGEKIKEAKNQKDAEAYEKLKPYPKPVFVNIEDWMSGISAVRKLQGKYGLAVKVGLPLIWKALTCRYTSNKITLDVKGTAAFNENLVRDLYSYSLYKLSREYAVPIYYLLGKKDFQTPYTIAEKYFETIEAPAKKVFYIVGAGHMGPVEKPAEYRDIIAEIIKENHH